MEKILYSKCSLERKEPYKIITSIIEKNDKKIVQKKAATLLANKHIENMYRNAKGGLINCNQNIRLVNVELQAEDELEVEYVDGMSFADILRNDIILEEWGKLYEHITQLKEWIFCISDVQPFESSGEFEKIFGNENLEGDISAKNINIDLIPENIIICNERPVMIDYEWIFECLIPLKYVLFRAIFFTGILSSLPDSKKNKIREITEISPEEEIVFLRMEKSFQQYISEKTLQDLYGEMGKSNYIISTDNLCDEALKIQVLDEKDVVLYEELTRSTDLNINVQLNGSKKIRVNIFEKSSIMKVLIEKDGDGNSLRRLESNAIINILDDFYFGDFIKIVYDVEGINEVKLSYQILNRNDNLISILGDTFVELQKLRGEYAEKEKWNVAYQEKVGRLESQLLHVGDERNEALNKSAKYMTRVNEQVELIEKQRAEILNLQDRLKMLESDYNNLNEKLQGTLSYKIRNKLRR